MKKNDIKKLTLSAMFLALALVMPFLTGQIPQIGAMLCPMHIPVLLCGFFCGGPWGLLVGFVSPVLRSIIFGMPTMFPKAICMAFELATYGLVSGLLHKVLPKKKWTPYLPAWREMHPHRIPDAAIWVSDCLSATPSSRLTAVKSRQETAGRAARSSGLHWKRRRERNEQQ